MQVTAIAMAQPRMNVNDLSSKVKSKKELYNFLLRDGQVYLPPLTSVNVYFLKQLMNGNKDVSCPCVSFGPPIVHQARQAAGGRRASD